MARLILVRHARTAETGITLSGRIKGIPLSPEGRREAAALADALGGVQIAGIHSSPMQRCLETAEAVRSTRGPSVKARPEVSVDERLNEVDYGEWSGRELRTLAKEPLWATVQRQPSAVTFPGGESLRAAAARAVEAVREIDARYRDRETWLCASHGDIIKAIVADALGIPLDLFQRIAEMLKDLSEGGSVQLPGVALPLPRKLPALAEPLAPEFRVGTIALAWDPAPKRLILEFRDDMGIDDAGAPPPISDSPEGPDVLRVSLGVATALEFAENALQLAAAGRAICPNCGVPLDPRGHRCARKAALLN